jgi:hypothetical protein
MIELALILPLLHAILARSRRLFFVVRSAESATAGASMNHIIGFLSLRPIWTRLGLEAVWCLLVLVTLLDLGWLLNSLVSSASMGHGFTVLYSALAALTRLALARVVLELALKFLVAPPEEAALDRR